MPFVRPIATAGKFNTALVDQSAWFDRSADYLSWTPGSAANSLKVWGFEAWVLRTGFSGSQYIFSAGPDSSNDEGIYFLSSGEIGYFLLTGGVNRGQVNTDAVFRDVGWYHVSVQKDATANSITIRVNGDVQTLTTSVSIANVDGLFGKQSTAHKMGALNRSTANFFNGYLAQATFTDGQNNAASDVGETYTLGTNGSTWVPKADSAIVALADAAGGNSFCLTSAIGDGTDASTNSNNFTPTSMSHAANGSDNTPSLVALKWNPLDVRLHGSGYGFGAGARVFSATGAAATQARSNLPLKGKCYWEAHRISNQLRYISLTSRDDAMANFSINSGRAGLHGIYLNQGGSNAWGPMDGTSNLWSKAFPGSISTDYLVFAFDADSGKLWCGMNGTFYDSAGTAITLADIEAGNSATITLSSSTQWHLCSAVYGETTTPSETNGGQLYTEASEWSSTPPTGFKALNTANLPTPEYQGADYFAVSLYTGDGSTGRSITGTGFQPDLGWAKARSNSQSHMLVDAVRGNSKGLQSDTTNAESTIGDSTNRITSFDSDGYTLGSDSSVNFSGYTYALWGWKANGSGVSNTDGSITSTVSVAEPGHFSIGTYTGTGANATVGHGLSGAPECVIAKERDNANAWSTYHVGVASDAETDFLRLDAIDAAADDNTQWNDTAPTSTVFSVGTANATNRSGGGLVFYAFRSVPGLCLVRDYTGNGSADGPYVYCGFKPRWIMWKRSDSTSQWYIADTARGDANLVNEIIYASLSNAEDTSSLQDLDILADGFKLRTSNSNSNASGGTYIFIAIADVAGGGDLPPIPGR